jgi:hypothetical protein
VQEAEGGEFAGAAGLFHQRCQSAKLLHDLLTRQQLHTWQPLASGPATTVATQAQERFRSWVGHLRKLNKLANDDVTLLIIQC